MYEYSATLLKVVDGDTIDVLIDLGFDVKIKQRLRLARINAPEMKTESGPGAKKAAEMELAYQVPNPILKIQTSKHDKYGRYIAEVIYKNPRWEEKNLSDIMVENGFAVYEKY